MEHTKDHSNERPWKQSLLSLALELATDEAFHQLVEYLIRHLPLFF